MNQKKAMPKLQKLQRRVKMMNKEELKMREMKQLAEVVAERPYLADIVGSQVYNISKCGARRLSQNEKWGIDNLDLNDEDVIPASVLLFLKKKKNIPKFIDMVRVEIWKKLKSNQRYGTETIIRYSVFFNMKDMKQIQFTNTNLTRLILVVAMEETGIFQDVEELDPEYIERLHDDLKMGPTADGKMLKASAKIYEALRERLECN